MKQLVIMGVLAVALVGCASTSGDFDATTDVSPVINVDTQPEPARQFLCENGVRPTIQHVSDEQIILTLNNTRTPLYIAPSGSGERYVATSGILGFGGQWHESVGEASFTYQNLQGKTITTRCSVKQ